MLAPHVPSLWPGPQHFISHCPQGQGWSSPWWGAWQVNLQAPGLDEQASPLLCSQSLRWERSCRQGSCSQQVHTVEGAWILLSTQAHTLTFTILKACDFKWGQGICLAVRGLSLARRIPQNEGLAKRAKPLIRWENRGGPWLCGRDVTTSVLGVTINPGRSRLWLSSCRCDTNEPSRCTRRARQIMRITARGQMSSRISFLMVCIKKYLTPKKVCVPLLELTFPNSLCTRH